MAPYLYLQWYGLPSLLLVANSDLTAAQLNCGYSKKRYKQVLSQQKKTMNNERKQNSQPAVCYIFRFKQGRNQNKEKRRREKEE